MKRSTPSNEQQQVLVAFPRLPQQVHQPVDAQLGQLDWQLHPTIVASTSTISLDEQTFGLSTDIISKCRVYGMESFFAVQLAVIPRILSTLPVDYYVHAPTGSGKTLAYVLPIVQSLSTRKITRLRALVIVPTKDLVSQVKQVLDAFTKGTNLTAAALYGQNTFKEEQSMLVHDARNVVGTTSNVDILVCTPGRLVDHIQQTKHFSLAHVQYLVIDEVDRLLAQSFQEWLPLTIDALERPVQNACDYTAGRLLPVTDVSLVPKRNVCKLLFSATMANDPEKLALLHLHNMQCISVRDADLNATVTIPSSLVEHMITLETSEKPLHVIHLMLSKSLSSVLCFTKSVESSQRLCRLIRAFCQLDSFPSFTVEDLTGQLDIAQRKSILKRFKQGDIQLLICSDLVARGMDMHVEAVIVYDMPNNVNTYAHRIGRCARAGKSGQSWVLIEHGETRPFKDMMVEANRWEYLHKERIASTELEYLVKVYDEALKMLEAMYRPSKRG